MGEDTLILLPDFYAKAHEIALGAVHTPGFKFRIKQYVAGIKIAEPDAKGLLRFRNENAATIVEIEPYSPSRQLGRQLYGRRIGSLLRLRGRLRWNSQSRSRSSLRRRERHARGGRGCRGLLRRGL